MTPFFAIWLALSAHAAVCFVLVAFQAVNWPRAIAVGAAAAMYAAMLVPVDGLPIAAYVRSVIGDPSVTGAIALTLVGFEALTRRLPVRRRQLSALLLAVIIGGAFLYPMTLGLSRFDPYALGYGSWWLYGALLAVALGAAAMDLWLLGLCVSLAVAAFVAGLGESTNVWDYLMDPLVFLFALGWGAAELAKWIVRRPAKEQTAA